MIDWPVPFSVTVPPLEVKVPPELFQLPETFILPLGAVSVPDDNVTVAVVTVPLEPVKTPPLTVKPPLKVWVAVEA